MVNVADSWLTALTAPVTMPGPLGWEESSDHFLRDHAEQEIL